MIFLFICALNHTCVTFSQSVCTETAVPGWDPHPEPPGSLAGGIKAEERVWKSKI